MHRICIFLLVFICSSIGQRVVISIQATEEFPFSFTCPNGQVLFSNQYFSAESFLALDATNTDGFLACANSFSDNIDASFNLSQTSTRITETVIFTYKESEIFHSILNSTDFYSFQLRAIVIYGRDLGSEDQVQIDIAFIGNTCGDSVRDSDLGEECDSTSECDSYCGCLSDYQVDMNNLRNTHCIVAPNLGLLWLLVPFVAIVTGLVVVLSVLKRKGYVQFQRSLFRPPNPATEIKLRCCNGRDPEPDEEVEMSKLQPIIIAPHNYPPQPYFRDQPPPPQAPQQPLPYPPLRSVLPPSNFGSAPVIPYSPNQPPMPILPPPGHNPYGPSPYMEAPSPMTQINYGPPHPPY